MLANLSVCLEDGNGFCEPKKNESVCGGLIRSKKDTSSGEKNDAGQSQGAERKAQTGT
jgi:hypothetical protein